MSKTYVKLCYGFATYYMGRAGILNIPFKIPLIICHCLSEICEKEKDQVLCMLFQKTPICFNESGYVTLYTIMNIITEHGAKMPLKMRQ